MIVRGEHVTLRPFRAEELDVLVAHQVMTPGDDSPEALARLEKVIADSGTLGEDGFLRFAVEHDGRLVGDVQARRPPRSLPPGVYELGIGLFDTADRGRGLGREAVELLTTHLFDDPGTARVQLSTAVDNAAMRRVAELLGFREEGVLRAFFPAEGGGRADYVLYAVTREDWEGR